MAGWLYLLHFDAPLSGKRASHYLGWSATKPDKRIQEHATGTGRAVFTTEAYRQGITFQVGNVWSSKTKDDERRLKRQRNHRRYCAICRPNGIARVMPTPRYPVTNGHAVATRDDDFLDLPY